MILGGILAMLCVGIVLSVMIVIVTLVIGHGKALLQLEDHYDTYGEIG